LERGIRKCRIVTAGFAAKEKWIGIFGHFAISGSQTTNHTD
jgi:hypothetical protein